MFFCVGEEGFEGGERNGDDGLRTIRRTDGVAVQHGGGCECGQRDGEVVEGWGCGGGAEYLGGLGY